jgi:hypothetical protein
MTAAGGWSLTAAGGAQAMFTSITAELQYWDKNKGVWTSWNPPNIQNATIGGNGWQAGWTQLDGGFSYRVVAVFTWQQWFPADPVWRTKTQTNFDFTRTFP